MMLILTRRVGENIRIGDDITVTIVQVHGKQIKLGIAAPEDVEVHREEIYRRIHPQPGTRAVPLNTSTP